MGLYDKFQSALGKASKTKYDTAQGGYVDEEEEKKGANEGIKDKESALGAGTSTASKNDVEIVVLDD